MFFRIKIQRTMVEIINIPWFSRFHHAFTIKQLLEHGSGQKNRKTGFVIEKGMVHAKNRAKTHAFPIP